MNVLAWRIKADHHPSLIGSPSSVSQGPDWARTALRGDENCIHSLLGPPVRAKVALSRQPSTCTPPGMMDVSSMTATTQPCGSPDGVCALEA